VPASKLLLQSGRTDLLRVRRPRHELITVTGIVVWVRDQAPLHRGNLRLPKGYSFEDFIESLNARVFFWPGTAAGPIAYGVRHFERYKDEHPIIIRASFSSVVLVNPGGEPRFCRYNSGSPRCSYGEKSPRGPNTFLHAAQFRATPSEAVEVTFDTDVTLPKGSQCGEAPAGPWRTLF
jgi:hypothetical protein